MAKKRQKKCKFNFHHEKVFFFWFALWKNVGWVNIKQMWRTKKKLSDPTKKTRTIDEKIKTKSLQRAKVITFCCFELRKIFFFSTSIRNWASNWSHCLVEKLVNRGCCLMNPSLSCQTMMETSSARHQRFVEFLSCESAVCDCASVCRWGGDVASTDDRSSWKKGSKYYRKLKIFL